MTFARKNYWPVLGELIFCLFIFLASVLPLRDFDIWFHLKSGEIIAKYGIIHHDVFSWSANGREWFPYEWLYQWSMYQIQQLFGLPAIMYVTALIVTIQIGLVYLLLRRIFRLGRLGSMIVSFLFFSSVFEFYAARPHIVAYTLLIATIYLILDYLKNQKNHLWLAIPLTFVWSNLHGSLFLSPALFGGYAFFYFLSFWKFKNLSDLPRAKTLAIYALVTGIITLLPPVGITQYRLLWYFFRQSSFLAKYIDEWTPLITNQFSFLYYSTEFLVIMVFFVFTVVRKKLGRELLYFLPLVGLLVLSFTASRNVFLGYIGLLCLIGFTLKAWSPNLSNRKSWRTLSVVLIILIIGIHGWFLSLKRVGLPTYYPTGAVNFLLKHELRGHMFNEYGYGGYLLYYLYPQYQVFFDGRTDVYLCCEMPDTLEMAVKKYEPDDQYKKFLDSFWNKYHISYVILRTQKHSVIRKITGILTDDPNWSLIYWDDVSQIFVRHDGLNDSILEKFAASAATPYSRDPYRPGQEAQAMTEYQNMIQVSDSARSRNAIGYLLLKLGKTPEAELQFQRATLLDPTFESPYMNLAEIAASQNNLDEAINLYRLALKYAPDRGLIYQRLGELLIQSSGDQHQAQKIWQQGIVNTVDADAKKKLQELLAQP